MRSANKEAVKRAAAAALLCLPAAAFAGGLSLPAFSVSPGVPLLAAAPSTGAVVAQGGNYCVPLPDGRALWLLNNVWVGERKGGGETEVWGIIDGAAAVAPSTAPAAQPGSLRHVSEESGWPLPLLSGDLGEYSQVRKFWPRAGLCAAGRCHVFYSIMNNYGPGPYDYFRVGQGVAAAAAPEGPYVKARRDGRYSLWNDIEPAFGSAVLADEDGWIYVYGRTLAAPGNYAVQLARVKPERIAEREGYAYYSAAGSSVSWTADPAEAADLLPGLPEEFSVSWNEALGVYLAVYSDADGRALARLAPAPWGPWGEPAVLLACAKEEYCYGAKEQPGLAAEGGRKIFLTVERKNSPYLHEVNFKKED